MCFFEIKEFEEKVATFNCLRSQEPDKSLAFLFMSFNQSVRAGSRPQVHRTVVDHLICYSFISLQI